MLQSPQNKSLLSDDTKAACAALRLALEPFVEMSPTIPVSYIITLCAVAEKEGLPVSQYARETGLLKAVATRHLLDMGERDRHGNEGFRLVEQKRDIKDLRINRTYINAKGAALLNKVRRALELLR